MSAPTEEARSQIDWLWQSSPAAHGAVLSGYQRLRRGPLGRWRFRRALAKDAPVIAALEPQVHDLRLGSCSASLAAGGGTLTQDGEVDAAAITSLAQFVAQLLVDVSVPDSVRWQCRGLTIEHLSVARTRIAATASLDKADWSGTQRIGVPVRVIDDARAEISRAVISFALTVQPG